MTPYEQVQLALYNRLKDIDARRTPVTPILMAGWLREDIPAISHWTDEQLGYLAYMTVKLTPHGAQVERPNTD